VLHEVAAPITCCWVTVGAGSGATSYSYWLVWVDINGNKSTPYSFGTVTNNAVLAPVTAYNILNGVFPYPTGASGVRCVDILVGDTAHSLATCVTPNSFPVYDDGSASHLAYTAPTRDATGDMSIAGMMRNGSTTVSGLPTAAAGNKGWSISVSDSTAVAAEGQTCVGGSTNMALAFSNGTVWKCF
jgi:hypothetical protein